MQHIPEFIGNHLLLVGAFIATLVALLVSEALRRKSGPSSLSPEGLVQLMNSADPVIMDVRGSADFKKGHIIGARRMTADQLSSAAGKLKADDKPVVVCCATGMHAPRSAAVLKAAGLSHVSILRGGIAAWREAKLPLARK